MIVIKLGGSLLAANWLLPCLEKIENSYKNHNIVIVPGGGVFADEVRILQKRFQFNDMAAHEMAILAMQQMALLLHGLRPNFKVFSNTTEYLDRASVSHITIWSPNISELNQAGIEPSWDVTSDSLAAWLANTLRADKLILVKSAKMGNNFDVRKLVEQQIVDARFAGFLQHAIFKLTIIHAEDFLSSP